MFWLLYIFPALIIISVVPLSFDFNGKAELHQLWLQLARQHDSTKLSLFKMTTNAQTKVWNQQDKRKRERQREREREGGRKENSQLSSCMVQVWMSIGKFFKSMGQERIRVSLRRKQNTEETDQKRDMSHAQKGWRKRQNKWGKVTRK